jgi:putative copper resistance protein D
MLLGQLCRISEGRVAVCSQVLRRFSNLGVVFLAVLLTSGIINTWFLTDVTRGLVGTDYGRLVQIKMALFIVIFCLAAVNRLRLLPRLSQVEGSAGQQQIEQTLGQVRRNTTFETALGLVAIYIVGMLGVTPPAGHFHGG